MASFLKSPRARSLTRLISARSQEHEMETADVVRTKTRSSVLNYLSLFTSLGTLLCCALPSLLVLLGLGATVATVLSSVPWLVSLSHHKVWVFAVAGVLIG